MTLILHLPHFFFHGWLVARMAVSGLALTIDLAVVWRTFHDRRRARPAILTQFEAWSIRWAPWAELGVTQALLLLLLSALAQSTAPRIVVVLPNQFSLLGASVLLCVRSVLLLYLRRRGQRMVFKLDGGPKGGG